MKWNHRVIRQHYDFADPSYIVAEVYYEDDGTIIGWSTPSFYADTADDLAGALALMTEAFEEPVLNDFDLPLDEAVDGF